MLSKCTFQIYTYGLFTLFSFNCELVSKESGLSLEQIIKIYKNGLKQIIKRIIRFSHTLQAVKLLFQQIQHLADLKYYISIEIL